MPRRNTAKSIAKPVNKALSIIAWITGVLVALAVGFGMTGGTLTVPYVQPIVPLAGWIVIVLTIIGAIMAIAEALK